MEDNTINKPEQEETTAKTVVLDEKADADKNKFMAFLSYWGILFLVPLFAAKDSAFARFHANQGILLFIFFVAMQIINNILIRVSTTLYYIVYLILYVFFVVLFFIGIINALKGKKKTLPLIGNLFTFVK